MTVRKCFLERSLRTNIFFQMGLWTALTRRKVLQDVVNQESKLGKVLTVFDLTALGVGSTLGVGVYVLAGSVSREEAGPGVVLSFFIAAVASVFAGKLYCTV